MQKVLNRAVARTTAKSRRHIAGFAEQTHHDRNARPELTDAEANALFAQRAQSIKYPFAKYGLPITAVHSNLLPSNEPTEDRRTTCVSRGPDGAAFMTGVFDGHAGPYNAQAVSERLFYYIYMANCTDEEIRVLLDRYKNRQPLPSNPNFFRTINEPKCDRTFFHLGFLRRLMDFGASLIGTERNVLTSIHEAAMRLDQDILDEALEDNADIYSIRAAINGCVACWSYIADDNLYVGNVGDSAALLISDFDGEYRATKMSSIHSHQNEREVRRITMTHPREDRVLLNNRLLGCLSPLRAFGDARFKLSFDQLNDLEGRMYDLHFKDPDQVDEPGKLVLPFYRSPPYLNSIPQIRYHRLGPRDRALVIASDGLWDELSHKDVADLVGAYMDGDSEVHESNAATMLMRRAIGEGWDGYDELEVRRSLAIEPGHSRNFRDDITIQVVFF